MKMNFLEEVKTRFAFIILIALIVVLCGCSKTPVSSIQNSFVSSTPTINPTNNAVPSPTAIITPDFRSVRWGMTKDEVKSAESNSVGEEDDTHLAYDVQVAGNDYGLVYTFNNSGMLYEAAYILSTQHSNDNIYITDFNDLKDTLTSKYGTPSEDNIISKNQSSLYKDGSDNGMAVATGDLMYKTIWKTDKTKITLALNGDNYQITLICIYDSVEIPAPAKDTSGF